MYSSYFYNKDFQIKPYLSERIHNKTNSNKRHSDSLNCLFNCSKFRITLYITQKPFNGKDNIFYVQKGEKFSPLFFYDIPSNIVIDEMQSKNESQKLLNNSQNIKTENEIIDKYEQNKKHKMLLFKYITFPLKNINKENNENKISTLIILDNGENDIISNFSTNSSYLDHQTCCISLQIKNTNNCDFLFSLSDIKDCKEIKIKLNGTVHEQDLFDKEIICYLSPELIEDSIRKRMEKYSNNDNIEDLLGKYFFTKLNDINNNNIGILFSLKKKNEKSKSDYDKEYLKSDRYLINKIFLFIDIWLNDNDKKQINTISSTMSSSYMILNNKLDEKDINNKNNNFYYYPNHPYFSYPNYYYNKNNSEYEINNEFNKKFNEINNSTSNIILNDINKIYLDNKKITFNNNYPIMNSNNIYNSNYDISLKKDNEYDNYYYNKETELNSLFNLMKQMELNNIYTDPELFSGTNNYKSGVLNYQEKLNKNFIETESEKSNYSLSNNQINKNIFIKRTLFINMNEELMRKLFEKYEQDKCISNYTIVKNMLDISINLDLNKIKLMDFFDIFHNANQLFLNIPFITKNGKLFMNCFSPTLSSMLLVLKINNKIKKDIKNNCKKFKGFRAETFEKNKKIMQLEFEEIKPIHKRELLYIKISKIKKILGEAKLKYKNILVKNSYFSILWSVTNNVENKSSFLAYYSFDFKLIGILILKLNYNNWMSPFSYKLDYYHDYKSEYEKNVQNVKKMFEELPIDKDDQHCDKYFKYDYYNYLKSNKTK